MRRISELQNSLICRMSSRSVRATERNHVLSKHKINKYDKIIKFVGEWEELEKKIIPSNITQIQKAKYGIHSLYVGINC